MVQKDQRTAATAWSERTDGTGPKVINLCVAGPYFRAMEVDVDSTQDQRTTSDAGAAAVEYALLVALVAVFLVGSVILLRGAVIDAFTLVTTTVRDAIDAALP